MIIQPANIFSILKFQCQLLVRGCAIQGLLGHAPGERRCRHATCQANIGPFCFELICSFDILDPITSSYDLEC